MANRHFQLPCASQNDAIVICNSYRPTQTVRIDFSCLKNIGIEYNNVKQRFFPILIFYPPNQLYNYPIRDSSVATQITYAIRVIPVSYVPIEHENRSQLLDLDFDGAHLPSTALLDKSSRLYLTLLYRLLLQIIFTRYNRNNVLK